MRIFLSCLIIFLIFIHGSALAQKHGRRDSTEYGIGDTTVKKGGREITVNKDSLLHKKHDPGKASLYSAIIPGGGQIYNHKYWKLPLVYAAVGIPGYLYFYNRKWYEKFQYAIAVSIHNSQGDSLAKVDPTIRPYITNTAGIISVRDSYRKNEDYSVLFFLLFWGLQVVDATVDAHLRDFSVSSDLSFKIKPNLVPWPYFSAGVSVVFDIHKAKLKELNQIQ